jgi:hypothetical protein
VVSITSSGLQKGTYAGQIVFSLGASNITVNVSLTVQAQQPKPCLTVSSSSLSFTSTQGAGDPATQSVTLANCGPADSWSATTVTKDGASWLSATPTSGNLSASSSQPITIAITSGKLTAGNYTGTVTFTSTAGAPPQTVTVLWTMLAPPLPTCIKANPTSLTFTGTTGQSDPATQTVTLTNCGPAGTWTGADANNTGWLSLSPANGSLNANATQDVSVTVSLGSLQAKTYTTTITFSTGTTPTSVAVTFNVQQKSCLNVSTSSLSFSATQGRGDPAPQTVTLTNCGQAPSSWTGTFSTTDGTHWLYIRPPSGSLAPGATQDVAVITTIGYPSAGSYLSAGTYTGSVRFSDGTNALTVNVTLTVSPSSSAGNGQQNVQMTQPFARFAAHYLYLE